MKHYNFAPTATICLALRANTASATSYGDCVAATWDPIGCAFNPNYEDWGGMNIHYQPGDLDKETFNRVSDLQAKGVFKNYEDLGKASISGKYRQSCDMKSFITLVEKGAGSKDLMKRCYKPAK
jgi:hypothetical protein